MEAEQVNVQQGVEEPAVHGRIRDLEAALRNSSGLLEKTREEMASMRQTEVYIAPQEEVGRFRDRPVRSTDLTAEDWAEEVRAELLNRQQWPLLKKADFVLRKLGGAARREVLARGPEVSSNADLAINLMLSMFGEDRSGTKLQEKFFGAHQEEGKDLIHLSLRLVVLIDAFISIDPSYRVKRLRREINRIS